MKKILVIEDELAYLKLLNDQLSAKEYKVFEAVNGKEGLEMARKEKPDLILLDIKMPVMDGMVMLKLLRKEEIRKNLPTGRQAKVIMLTNLEPDEEITKGVVSDRPLYYFIKSDMQFSDLLKKIEELLADNS